MSGFGIRGIRSEAGLIFVPCFFCFARTLQDFSELKMRLAVVRMFRNKPTQDYLESTMGRITLVGAVFLALIAILPQIVGKLLGVDSTITYFFGGTSRIDG